MTTGRNAAIALLNSMPEVICVNGLYRSASQKSKHIVKLVEDQDIKSNRKPPFRPIYPSCRQQNSSFPSANRRLVS